MSNTPGTPIWAQALVGGVNVVSGALNVPGYTVCGRQPNLAFGVGFQVTPDPTNSENIVNVGAAWASAQSIRGDVTGNLSNSVVTAAQSGTITFNASTGNILIASSSTGGDAGISISSCATNSYTGQSITLAAQDSSNGTGGNINLRTGVGIHGVGTDVGIININLGGTIVGSIGNTQGGQGFIISMANVQVPPTSWNVAGSLLYSNAGTLTWIDNAGSALKLGQNITFDTAYTAPAIQQASATSGSIPASLTITSQAPCTYSAGNPSAALQTPGDVIVNLSQPGTQGTAPGSWPMLRVNSIGGTAATIGTAEGVGMGASMWLDENTPSAKNFALHVDSTGNTILNAPLATIFFGISGSLVGGVNSVMMNVGSGKNLVVGANTFASGGYGSATNAVQVYDGVSPATAITSSSIIFHDAYGTHVWESTSGSTGLDFMIAPEQQGLQQYQRCLKREYFGTCAMSGSGSAAQLLSINIPTNATAQIETRLLRRLTTNGQGDCNTVKFFFKNISGSVSVGSTLATSSLGTIVGDDATNVLSSSISGTNVIMWVSASGGGTVASPTQYSAFSTAYFN